MWYTYNGNLISYAAMTPTNLQRIKDPILLHKIFTERVRSRLQAEKGMPISKRIIEQ